MTDFILYPLLGTLSKRAISRKTWRGRKYDYKPRADLLDRLTEETKMTRTEVYFQLLEERKKLLEMQPD